jgi:nitric oxide synthase oxygenase domain/subunit
MNGGLIFRIWNSQFISYAGYKVDEQTFIGDKAQIEFTEVITAVCVCVVITHIITVIK